MLLGSKISTRHTPCPQPTKAVLVMDKEVSVTHMSPDEMVEELRNKYGSKYKPNGVPKRKWYE